MNFLLAAGLIAIEVWQSVAENDSQHVQIIFSRLSKFKSNWLFSIIKLLACFAYHLFFILIYLFFAPF